MHTKNTSKSYEITYRPYRHEGREEYNLVERTYNVWLGDTFSSEGKVAGFNAVSVADNSIKRFKFEDIVSLKEVIA